MRSIRRWSNAKAIKLLNGEKIEKIILDTASIATDNADQILKENGSL
jgi:hypothetical protein